jgi:hypothetical protein
MPASLLRNLLLAAAAAFGAPIARVIAEPDGIEFFEKKIRPVLVAECCECHGAQKHKGGLRLDFRDGWKAGGDSGAAIVPGRARESLLIRAIRHEDPDLKMPSKAPKLDESVIADFEKWIDLGAPDPRDAPPLAIAGGKPSWDEMLAARKSWWALQPVQRPAVPAVRDAAWPRTAVDHFLLAKMEAHRLAPAPDADPRTLIRRLTLTLTGLPPTPAEVAAFVSGTSALPDRVRALADRLLASPRFGEHWARHWMDLVRYADTHGSEGDPAIPEAWRYRDYLIRAFNADVPIDQLIREHLAGDLLREPRWNREEQFNESLLGTAHLRLVEHGFQPVDTRDEQVKTLDSQIDVMSKAFQGLTVSCARCHDHKFDAISQRDYYAIAGVFESCRPALVTIDSPERLRAHADELARLKAQVREALASAWLREVSAIEQRLLAELQPDAFASPAAIARLDAERDALLAGGRARLGKKAAAPVVPIARWSFESDARDALGSLHGELKGGAQLRNGRVVLDGKAAHVRSAPIARDLREKTLEAWVTLADLEQQGGAAISIENARGDQFDAIVFGERERGRWMAGSESFRRTRNFDGPLETAKPDELIHVAATYREDGTIAIFRNGVPYSPAWKPGAEPLVAFARGDAHVLLGLRHAPAANGYFAGEVEDARLYDRALNPEEIAASFRAGPHADTIGREELLAALTRDERERFERITRDLDRARLDEPWRTLRAAAASEMSSPLHAWAVLTAPVEAEIATRWESLAREILSEPRPAPTLESAGCFRSGVGIEAISPPGEFAILPAGDRIVTGLRPAGAVTDRLSNKHGGVLATPRFRVETDFISVFAAGGGGAQVRLICDGYPLGNGGIFPRATLDQDAPAWLKLDVKYRRGTWAYLEFATARDVTRRDGDPPERSWFAVGDIVFHDGDLRRRAASPLAALLSGDAPRSAPELARRYADTLTGAVAAWRDGTTNAAQSALLDSAVLRGLLPGTLARLPELTPLIAEYRRIEAAVPAARRAPGVRDEEPLDAAFLPKGDHTKPGDPVPRGYLGVLGVAPFATRQSGRLELAERVADPGNPLTARVAVNRIWHWIFGRGLVPTPDNFGRMGERPTHPELLDWLAVECVARGWSGKELIRLLVTSRAFQIASEPSDAACQHDSTNALLSHFRTRRLEAETIRDSLLAAAGSLDLTMFGPGADSAAPRRSVYLAVRRTSLDPFLAVFDAPKPFSTLGRRDTTNVPAQSLTLLNSPFAIAQAQAWAREVVRANADSAGARVAAMFERAFARPPAAEELRASLAFLDALAAERQLAPDARLADKQLWQDLAQSLFNLKEFIYLR